MRLTFLGAARMVTGSSYLLEVGQDKILIDCGMFQGSKAISNLNRRPFAYDPSSITSVLLSHAHIDHSGLLPKLCKEGFKGPIYATQVTAELCKIMLPDSAHIQEFDAEIANRKGLRAGKAPVEPIYTLDDAYACLMQFKTASYTAEMVLSPNITVRFQDAGHILGSSVIDVYVTEQGQTTKLLFSGDLGQPDQPIIQDPTYVDEADYIITESTYGNRKHQHYDDKEERFAQVINDTVKRGGNIIIPSFAVGRTQTVLYYIHKLRMAGIIPDIKVVIDSPLAISATDIFMHNTQDFDNETKQLLLNEAENPLNWPKLTFTKTADESKALNHLEEPAVIISASGMADAGRILHHLKHNLWRPESSIIFVGYQAEGSLGRRLIEGAKRVKIMGEEISVRAQVYNLEGFSAHADQDQLLDWLGHFKIKPMGVFLVHGEFDMSAPFAQLIESTLGYPTYIPRYGDAVTINGKEWSVIESDIIVEPAVKELFAYLQQVEIDFQVYRKRLEQIAVTDPSKIPELLDRFVKLYAPIKKTLNDL
ncbi:MAG: MBL fold metallo-hydrolase RNA specificity domain-containing protein [Negativicutes bacterium]|nr:MBL fold metallo-hydrolase RNA specificity domain-containing protein [Negativicutes bacterium]